MFEYCQHYTRGIIIIVIVVVVVVVVVIMCIEMTDTPQPVCDNAMESRQIGQI